MIPDRFSLCDVERHQRRSRHGPAIRGGIDEELTYKMGVLCIFLKDQPLELFVVFDWVFRLYVRRVELEVSKCR